MLAAPPLTPELRVWQATARAPIWEATEAELEAQRLPPPFWAFPWAGGQALARFLMDAPENAAGRRVLAFGCGGGLEALAAARVGAAEVWANDVDPVALVAASMNAEANGLSLRVAPGDLLDGAPAPPVDLILVGDAFYERALSARILRWLEGQVARGAEALIGDAGRGMVPDGLRRMAVHEVPTPRALEDRDARMASVWRLGRR